MSREIFEISTDIFKAAVAGLRTRLRLSQEEIAHEIGCSVYTFQKWETGKARPSGDWIIRMMRLCPDELTRSRFWTQEDKKHLDKEGTSENSTPSPALRADGRVKADPKFPRTTRPARKVRSRL